VFELKLQKLILPCPWAALPMGSPTHLWNHSFSMTTDLIASKLLFWGRICVNQMVLSFGSSWVDIAEVDLGLPMGSPTHGQPCPWAALPISEIIRSR